MWLERRPVFFSALNLPSEPKKPLRRGDADCDCVCALESRGDDSILSVVLCNCEPSALGPPDSRSAVD